MNRASSRSPRRPRAAAQQGYRCRGERGVSTVELAVVLPLLLSVILGLFTGGAAYVSKVSLVDAVREGTRHGAALPVPLGGGGPALWEAAVRDRVVSSASGALSPGDVCVRLVLATGATDCGVSDPPGTNSDSGIHLVKVSASRPATIQILVTSFQPILRAALVSRYERDTG